MKTKFILLSFALAALALSCQRPAELEAPQPELVSNPETKLVKLGDEYAPSSFLVKFRTLPTADDLAACYQDGVLSVEPYFVSVKGKEELEHQFGLDRWYEVTLEEGQNIDLSILGLAALDQVTVAEYKCIPQKASDGIFYPVSEEFVTKGTVEGGFNDPLLIDQWHYNNQGSKKYSSTAVKGADVNVKDVWANLTCGDRDIIVAVVDEAVCYSNPDIAANMWINKGETPGNGIDDDGNGYVDDVYGYNFVDNNANINWENPNDSGHGTHCAGTIAAVNNNNKGVSGIAGGSGNNDGCRIMSCQIFSGKRGGDTSKAIKYAADNGASVISCSYGFTSPFSSDASFYSYSTAEIDAIHYFEATKNNPVLNGNIAIFAAGNENHNYAHYPGAFVDIISVSAFGPDYLPTYYTNYGPGCNIAAPGGEAGHLTGTKEEYSKSMVLSTLPKDVAGSDYGYMQGTSMACPHVSGVVALALSYAKQLGKTFTVQEFKELILSSTNDIDQRIAGTAKKTYKTGWSIADLNLAPYYHQMGTGAIDAWRLMMNIEGVPSATAQLGKSQWIGLESIYGSSSVSLTYLAVDIPQSTIDALGLQKISGESQEKYPCIPEGECYGYVQFGRLYIHPTKLGSGKIAIKAVGGGDHVGGGNNPPGGMELDREISIIARDVPGGNGTGGWL